MIARDITYSVDFNGNFVPYHAYQKPHKCVHIDGTSTVARIVSQSSTDTLQIPQSSLSVALRHRKQIQPTTK